MASSGKRDPRRAYRVVDLFEQELADYCGAPYAVAVNSATNAIFLALMRDKLRGVAWHVELPRRTYVGVLQSALNAGLEVNWLDNDGPWQEFGWYALGPLRVVDSARFLARGMWEILVPRPPVCCLSFHSAKQLPLGRGGAILTDNLEAAEWFRAARMDGRPPGAPIEETVLPGWHMPCPPDVAARGLDILSRWNDADYSPPPLPPTTYADLSLIHRAEVTV